MKVSNVQNVGFTANSTNVASTNYIDEYRKNAQKPAEAKDKVTLNRDFIVDLKHNTEATSFGTVVEGYVNGKDAAFKVVSNNDEENWIEGTINKKYMLLHAKDKLYDGRYGDQEFELTVDYNKPSKLSEFYNQKIRGKIFMPDYFSVKGHIGDKEVDITLPNVKIPEDPEIRDLLALVLEDNGFKAQTIAGEIKSIKFSPSAIKNIKKKSEKRDKVINSDIKPLVIQSVSTGLSILCSALISALLVKIGLHKK